MLLFISILIIVGLDMSYFWLIPAIVIWLFSLNDLTDRFKHIADNQEYLLKNILKKKDCNE